jgi:anti-sigma factor RsiW
MKCRRITRLLSPWQDGELDAALGEELERHLLGCPACRGRCDALRELRRRLLLQPPPADDPFLPARVMARLQARPLRPRPLARAAAWAAVFAAVFAGGFLLQTSLAPGAAPEPEPAASYSSVLLESREFGLLAVHDDFLDLFSGGGNEAR